MLQALPLFVLALQPGGRMTVARAESYLRSCRSNNSVYRVTCCEVNPPLDPDETDMSKRAYTRAVAALALPQYADAVVAIGIHSHTVTLTSKVMVRKASLALVQRLEPEKPFLFDQSGDLPDSQARLVAEALKAWQVHTGKIVPLTDRRSVAVCVARSAA